MHIFNSPNTGSREFFTQWKPMVNLQFDETPYTNSWDSLHRLGKP